MAIKFEAVPEWVKPQTPSPLALWEAFALLGWEGKPVRLSAADQRALMGFAVFGKQLITIADDGSVTITVSVCFGTMTDHQTYSPEQVKRALMQKLLIVPSTASPRHFAG